MTNDQTSVARACLEGSENDTLSFPAGVKQLIDAGFERYAVDFCRDTRTYYLPNGESIALQTAPAAAAVGESFDVEAVKGAIREAQQMATGYTYTAFCERIMRAGCVGYAVSFPGRRAVYSARTGEAHVEHFPD